MPLLKYFDLSLQWFYISSIKIVLASCHRKNYFVITYLLEDEQELSLGMLRRCKRIYNFLCSMLVFYPMSICFLHIFTRLPLFFRMFSYTNILTRCPRPVVVFCMFLVSEIHLRKYSRNGQNPRKPIFTRNEDRDRRRPEGGPGSTQRGTRRGSALGRAWWAPGRSGRLFAYKLPLTLKSLRSEERRVGKEC